MSKISDLIAKLCPNGGEYKKLGELCVLEKGLTPMLNTLIVLRRWRML